MRFISRLEFVEVQSIEPQGMCATFGKKGLLTTCMEWFTTYLLKVASARHHLGTVRSTGVCRGVGKTGICLPLEIGPKN